MGERARREVEASCLPASLVQTLIRPATESLAVEVGQEVAEQVADDPRNARALARNVSVATRDALRQFVSSNGVDVTSLDVSRFRELGRRHGAAGHSRHELETVYRLGTRSLLRRAVQVCSEHDVDVALLEPISDAIFAVADTMLGAALEGYEKGVAEYGTGRAAGQLELVRWLADPAADLRAPELVRLADAAHWPLPGHVTVAVARSVAEGPLPPIPPTVVAATIGDRDIVVLAERDGAGLALLDELGRSRPVAVGSTVPFPEVRQSLEQAARLLEIRGEDGKGNEPGVARVEDHAVDLLLEREVSVVAQLVHDRLGELLALPARRHEPLLETLAVWLRRPGQLSAIAEHLHVHPQTVRYRVARLRELVGPQVDDPDHRVELALAVRAVERDLVTVDRSRE